MSERTVMTTIAPNRFLEDPVVSSDEDGSFAYVGVTDKTTTADDAREWLLSSTDGRDMLGYDEETDLLHPERVELRGVHVESRNPVGLLADAWPVERMIRDGSLVAWWEFDVSMAKSTRPDVAQTWDQRAAARMAEERRRATAWRGPRWWRLRCWAADGLATVAGRIDPDDRSSVSYLEGGAIVIAQVRRPERNRTAASGGDRS